MLFFVFFLIKFFTNGPQYKKTNIANIVLEKNYTNEINNLEMQFFRSTETQFHIY